MGCYPYLRKAKVGHYPQPGVGIHPIPNGPDWPYSKQQEEEGENEGRRRLVAVIGEMSGVMLIARYKGE